MTSTIAADIAVFDERPRSGAVTQVLMAFAAIGLGTSWTLERFFWTWNGVFVLASVPLVVLTLRRQPFSRTARFVFIPTLVAGTVTQLLWTEMHAALVVWSTLWLSCLVAGLTSPRHRKRPVSGRCGACDYDLTGNRSGTCPECSATVGTVARRGVRWWSVAGSLLAWIVGAAMGAAAFGTFLHHIFSQPI